MVWNAIISTIGSIGSAVASAVSTIGSAISSFASSIGPVLGSVIDALKPVAEALGRFVNAFLQGLGILQPNEKVEDIGERALQAAGKGITIDKFDNFDDYMDALRKFEVDPDIAAKRSPAEKLVAGIGVGTIGVEDKFHAERGSLNGMWLLPLTNPEYFTSERMQSLVSTGRLGGDIYAYLEKRLSGGEARGIEKSLEVGADGKPMNEAEQDKLYGALDAARDRWADLAKQVEAKHNQGS
jgi:hypothetical protein